MHHVGKLQVNLAEFDINIHILIIFDYLGDRGFLL